MSEYTNTQFREEQIVDTFEFDQYQLDAHSFSQNTMPPKTGLVPRLQYPMTGLVGEVGELNEIYKRIMRDDDGDVTPEHIAAMAYEIGDALWYLAEIATILGIDLSSIAGKNANKLAGRRDRNTINGSGHDR